MFSVIFSRCNRYVLIVTLSIFIIQSCKSTTVINSQPNEAKVFINESYIGVTPYIYKDDRIVFAETKITLKKEGYNDFNIIMRKDEKISFPNVCCGIAIWPLLFWSYNYNPERTYVLEPVEKKPNNK